MIEGKRVLELVPRDATLKGDAVAREIERHALEAVLYAGDDVADVAAFSALAEARTRGLLTVAVAVMGPESPEALRDAADMVVEGPSALVDLLLELAGARPDQR